MGRWEDRYVEVIAEGGHRRFFDRFLMAEEVTRLVMITPWIDGTGKSAAQFESTLRKIERDEIPTLVIVRHPSKELNNHVAVSMLASARNVSLHFNNELHAKIYACRCAPYGFAYVGSANLTGRATTAYEVGLLVDGIGEGRRVVDELIDLGELDLLGRAGTRQDFELSSGRGE